MHCVVARFASAVASALLNNHSATVARSGCCDNNRVTSSLRRHTAAVGSCCSEKTIDTVGEAGTLQVATVICSSRLGVRLGPLISSRCSVVALATASRAVLRWLFCLAALISLSLAHSRLVRGEQCGVEPAVAACRAARCGPASQLLVSSRLAAHRSFITAPLTHSLALSLNFASRRNDNIWSRFSRLVPSLAIDFHRHFSRRLVSV